MTSRKPGPARMVRSARKTSRPRAVAPGRGRFPLVLDGPFAETKEAIAGVPPMAGRGHGTRRSAVRGDREACAIGAKAAPPVE